MQKILLYYKFTPLSDPEAVKLWQKTLCDSLNLRGRILVSRHGLNGTVGGELEDLKKYVRETKKLPGFKDIVFKWSDGSRDDFPRMSVKNRRELVGFKNSDDEFEVDVNGVIGGINGAIGIINKIPGVHIGRIPRLERGGVLKRGQIGLLEGNGAEAVVPLEKNKAWIRAVAKDMAQIMPSVTTNNNGQTINFYNKVQSPDEIARMLRMQARYGYGGVVQ